MDDEKLIQYLQGVIRKEKEMLPHPPSLVDTLRGRLIGLLHLAAFAELVTEDTRYEEIETKLKELIDEL